MDRPRSTCPRKAGSSCTFACPGVERRAGTAIEIGVPAKVRTAGALVDPDPGVYGYDHAPLHRQAFKPPGSRSVALTPPYMRNGVYRTLAEVVDFYDGGGGAGIGIDLPNLTLPPEPLHLSRREKRDLVAFLGS